MFRCAQLFETPWAVAHQAFQSFTTFQSLLKVMFIKSVMLSNYLILCHPLLLPPSILPSIRVFSNEPALWIKWPKYWSFNFRIRPSNECSGLISFRIDRFDLLVVQGNSQESSPAPQVNQEPKKKSLKKREKGKKRNYLNSHSLYEADLEFHDSKTPLSSLLVFCFRLLLFFGSKLNIQKIKIMAFSPITSWQIDGETMETMRDFFSWAPKSLQMVSAAMKLKDTCCLEENL